MRMRAVRVGLPVGGAAPRSESSGQHELTVPWQHMERTHIFAVESPDFYGRRCSELQLSAACRGCGQHPSSPHACTRARGGSCSWRTAGLSCALEQIFTV